MQIHADGLRQEYVVVIEFRDDGAGHSADILHLEQHSIGYDLIQSIVDYMQGEINLYNDQGAVITIRFPASAVQESAHHRTPVSMVTSRRVICPLMISTVRGRSIPRSTPA